MSDAERTDLAAQLRAAWDAMPWWGEAEEAAGGDARKPDFAGVRFFKVPFVQVTGAGARLGGFLECCKAVLPLLLFPPIAGPRARA